MRYNNQLLEVLRKGYSNNGGDKIIQKKKISRFEKDNGSNSSFKKASKITVCNYLIDTQNRESENKSRLTLSPSNF